MKTLGKIIVGGLAAYVMFFLFWFLLISACTQQSNTCGDDAMMHVAQHLYGWILPR